MYSNIFVFKTTLFLPIKFYYLLIPRFVDYHNWSDICKHGLPQVIVYKYNVINLLDCEWSQTVEIIKPNIILSIFITCSIGNPPRFKEIKMAN